MRRKSIVVIAALAVAVLFALAQIASAGTPVSTAFTTTEASIGAGHGTFSASGAVADSGTFTADLVAFGAGRSPMVGTGHYLVVFNGEKDSLTLRAQVVFRPTADPLVFEDVGRWVIVGGSGAYAGLHGEGTLAGVVDFRAGTATSTWQGVVQLG